MARKSYGRTLVELMSVLAILSIIITTALPNLQSLLESNARAQSVNQMVSILQHARSSAVFSRRIVTLCSGQTNCAVNQHWDGQLLVFLDHNANGQLDADDELLQQAKITEEFSWHWNRSKGHIQFEADGSTRALNGTLTLCRDGMPQNQVVVSLSGRTRTQPPKKGAGC